MLFIITGGRGSGKTRLCQQVAAEAHSARLKVRGVLSPARMETDADGMLDKNGIDLVDASGGERGRLARRIPGDIGDSSASGTATGRWRFDPVVLASGNEILARAVPCDLLIVDELGPLEFMRGEGWLAGLAAVDSGSYRAALVVIRTELLGQAFARWPRASVIGIELGMDVPKTVKVVIESIHM